MLLLGSLSQFFDWVTTDFSVIWRLHRWPGLYGFIEHCWLVSLRLATSLAISDPRVRHLVIACVSAVCCQLTALLPRKLVSGNLPYLDDYG